MGFSLPPSGCAASRQVLYLVFSYFSWNAYTRSVPKRLLFVSNPVATWLSGWQEQKLMVYRLDKWLNTINKWTKWNLLLSAKFEFYTLLSAKYLYSSVFPLGFLGMNIVILSFSICLHFLSGHRRKYLWFYSVPAHNEIPNPFKQQHPKKMFRVYARWINSR